jgi:hypothetical protein
MPNLAPIPMPLLPPDFSRRWSGGVGLFAINSSDPSGQPTRASSLVIATPGCAGLRPACLPSRGRCPLGRHPSRPATPPPPGNGPAKARQKKGASPYLSGRFANHPDEPCRRRTSIDSGRGMGNGFTAPLGHGGFHASPPAVSRSTQFYVIADRRQVSTLIVEAASNRFYPANAVSRSITVEGASGGGGQSRGGVHRCREERGSPR